MRPGPLLLALCVVACFAAAASPAAAEQRPFQSDNVTLVTKLPEAVGAISARFSPNGRTMYVSGATGLGVYDVSKPADPRRLGRLPLPHFENEDLDVGHVGGRDLVIISNDPSFTQVGAIYIVDVTDPSMPKPISATETTSESSLKPLTDALSGVSQPAGLALNSTGTGTGNGHIMNCVQGCRYLWSTGTREGIVVYDIKDPSHPKDLGAFKMPAPAKADAKQRVPGFTHDVFVDRSGIAWVTGEDGTFGFDTNSGDPLKPRLVYRTDEKVLNSGQSGDADALDGKIGSSEANAYPLDFLYHNAIRTDINVGPSGGPSDAPVVTGSSAQNTKRPKAKKHRAKGRRHKARGHNKSKKRATRTRRPRSKVRPRTTTGGEGDVVAITEEDYTRPGCNGQGSLQTWQVTGERNSDGTTKLKLLDLWTTELNELRDLKGRSDPSVIATANCSAHWFDESGGLIAQGWYDQGVRFLDIRNPRDIKQVGYYVTAGTFWASYFAPADPTRSIVYALDTAGGIDVLKIDRKAPQSSGAKLPAADTRELFARDAGSACRYEAHFAFGGACPLLRAPGPALR